VIEGRCASTTNMVDSTTLATATVTETSFTTSVSVTVPGLSSRATGQLSG
jgi:hypothetical protein